MMASSSSVAPTSLAPSRPDAHHRREARQPRHRWRHPGTAPASRDTGGRVPQLENKVQALGTVSSPRAAQRRLLHSDESTIFTVATQDWVGEGWQVAQRGGKAGRAARPCHLQSHTNQPGWRPWTAESGFSVSFLLCCTAEIIRGLLP